MTTLFDNIDKKLLGKFKKYHTENPSVYKSFKRYAQKIRIVHKKYSAWTIINLIRWEIDLQGGDLFKINNDYIALYARLLMYYEPSFEGFFELRTMKAFDRRDSGEERYRKNDVAQRLF